MRHQLRSEEEEKCPHMLLVLSCWSLAMFEPSIYGHEFHSSVFLRVIRINMKAVSRSPGPWVKPSGRLSKRNGSSPI